MQRCDKVMDEVSETQCHSFKMCTIRHQYQVTSCGHLYQTGPVSIACYWHHVLCLFTTLPFYLASAFRIVTGTHLKKCCCHSKHLTECTLAGQLHCKSEVSCLFKEAEDLTQRMPVPSNSLWTSICIKQVLLASPVTDTMFMFIYQYQEMSIDKYFHICK